jgi:hypothetical protein
MLYVDNRRADSYTADGSVGKPFKTIMAAVNQIITNNDNSGTKPYGLFLATSIYAESVDLSNTALKCIVIMGNESTIGGASVTDAAIKAVNNNNLTDLLVCNCVIVGGSTPGVQIVDLEVNAVAAPGLFSGALATGSGCIFFFCQFSMAVVGGANGTVVFEGCYFGILGDANNGLNFTNVQNVVIRYGGGIAQGPVMNLVTNSGLAGYQFNATAALRYTTSQLDIRLTNTAGGGSFLTLMGARQRYNVTINNGCTMLSQAGTLITGPVVVNSGGEFDEYGGTHSGTLTVNAGGTYKQIGVLAAASLAISNGVFTGFGTQISAGQGLPNGTVVGSPGDLYLDATGGAGNTLWVKESGAATNTGWVGK